MRRPIWAQSFAVLDGSGNVLVEGPVKQDVVAIRSGPAHTIQLDMSDGSLLCWSAIGPSGARGYVLAGKPVRTDWPPRRVKSEGERR